MIPHSVLITQPALSSERLIIACSQMFDHKVSDGVDQCPRTLSDAERFLSFIDAMRTPGAPAGLPLDLLQHVTFSVLTVAEERDLLDILCICSGMVSTVAETRGRSIMAAVITGTLIQWREAVAAGCHRRTLFEVRSCFNQIHSLFVSAGLGSIWNGYERQDDGETFLLTHER